MGEMVTMISVTEALDSSVASTSSVPLIEGSGKLTKAEVPQRGTWLASQRQSPLSPSWEMW